MSATDSPDVAAAKRLLDLAKDRGFIFTRTAPGEDGPLIGRRETIEYRDQIYLAGFGDSCHATRVRKSGLLMPGGLPTIERAIGDAVTVLHAVVTDWPT
ncbi:MAG: hypothetical protein DLM60_03385 [Pseudonocardiales bacterium]|nr:MAG: hypothetical protein DLM60_03385 [Pseudonocardiales bacterium]